MADVVAHDPKRAEVDRPTGRERPESRRPALEPLPGGDSGLEETDRVRRSKDGHARGGPTDQADVVDVGVADEHCEPPFTRGRGGGRPLRAGHVRDLADRLPDPELLTWP